MRNPKKESSGQFRNLLTLTEILLSEKATTNIPMIKIHFSHQFKKAHCKVLQKLKLLLLLLPFSFYFQIYLLSVDTYVQLRVGCICVCKHLRY